MGRRNMITEKAATLRIRNKCGIVVRAAFRSKWQTTQLEANKREFVFQEPGTSCLARSQALSCYSNILSANLYLQKGLQNYIHHIHIEGGKKGKRGGPSSMCPYALIKNFPRGFWADLSLYVIGQKWAVWIFLDVGGWKSKCLTLHFLDRLGRANTESGIDHKNKKAKREWIRLIKILRNQVTSLLFYILCQNECVWDFGDPKVSVQMGI